MLCQVNMYLYASKYISDAMEIKYILSILLNKTFPFRLLRNEQFKGNWDFV